MVDPNGGSMNSTIEQYLDQHRRNQPRLYATAGGRRDYQSDALQGAGSMIIARFGTTYAAAYVFPRSARSGYTAL